MKIVITVTDNEDGTVAIVAKPNVADMINLIKKGAGLTSAGTYALRMLRAAQSGAKEARAREHPITIHSPSALDGLKRIRG